MARALWFCGPRRVEVLPADVSEPGEGEVLVQTLASGISAGTEMLAYRGELDDDLALDETLASYRGSFRYPFRYGYSCVGTVETSRAPVPTGSLVFAFHPHQDRFTVPAGDVVVLDPTEDPRRATLLPLVETALQIRLDAGICAYDTVVVSGLGPVGLLTALLLRETGATVVGVEPQAWRREVAASVGIEAVAPEAATARVSQGSGGSDGVPIVVEVSGNPSALEQSVDLLAHEGTVLVASWYGTKPVELPLGGRFHRRRLTVKSTQVSTIPARLSDRWSLPRRRATAAALARRLPLDAVATHEFPFSSAADAYAAIDRGEPGLMHAALRYD